MLLQKIIDECCVELNYLGLDPLICKVNASSDCDSWGSFALKQDYNLTIEEAANGIFTSEYSLIWVSHDTSDYVIYIDNYYYFKK